MFFDDLLGRGSLPLLISAFVYVLNVAMLIAVSIKDVKMDEKGLIDPNGKLFTKPKYMEIVKKHPSFAMVLSFPSAALVFFIINSVS